MFKQLINLLIRPLVRFEIVLPLFLIAFLIVLPLIIYADILLQGFVKMNHQSYWYYMIVSLFEAFLFFIGLTIGWNVRASVALTNPKGVKNE
jgi:hypothetical protein